MPSSSRRDTSFLKQQFRKYVHEYVFIRAPSVAVVRVLSVAFNLLFVSLVSRFAGPAPAGEFLSLYALILVVSSVGRLGAEQHLIARLPRATESERGSHITAIAAAVVLVTISLASVTAVVRSLLGDGFLFGASWSSFVLFWLATLLLSINWISVGALRGLGRHLASVLLETLVYLVAFATLILALNQYGTLNQTNMTMILVVSIGASCLIGVSFLRRTRVVLPAPKRNTLRRAFRDSGEFWIASSLSVANTWMPVLLVRQFVGVTEVGAFTLSHRLATLLLFGLMILNARYAYDYSRLSASHKVAELIALYKRNTLAQLPFL